MHLAMAFTAAHVSLILLMQATQGAPKAAPQPTTPAPASMVFSATAPATQLGPAEEAEGKHMDAYYLKICAMCPGLLGAKGEATTITSAGRQVRVCCPDCRASFERDPSAGIARIDATIIADQLPLYPLKTSLLDDRPLGPQPVDFVWGNRLFRAVDDAEREKILADPAAAIRSLNRAVIEAQRTTYGMPDKCPVQGDILPTDQRIDIVVANRMVRVCCAKCADVVRARPVQYLGMVEYANRDAARRRQDKAGAAR